MRNFIALAMVALLPLAVCAQDKAPKTIHIGFYGESAYDCAEKLAEQLGAKLHLHDLDEETLDAPCWLVRDEVTPQAAASLFAIAAGYPVSLDASTSTLHVYQPGVSVGDARVKGYDVSVLSGRFVEYVNNYGAPAVAQRPNEAPEPERTAAQHLADALDEILYDPRGGDSEPSVVGDRLLFTASEQGHARVREALDILVAEHGGESEALRVERTVIERLKAAEFSAEIERTPVASVLTAICKAAALGIVLGPDLAEVAVEEHIDFPHKKGTSALAALKQLTAQMAAQDLPIDISVREGTLVADLAGRSSSRGYRVYDVTELLKKLDASYQRQRTAPGKDEGFDGDVRRAGGNRVVLDSLEELLDEVHQGEHATCICFGTRLVVRGGCDAVDAATNILKEMGWEESGN